MIDFYFWTTPNGYKVLVFLEESGIPYNLVPINISKGEQFEQDYLKISPNNKIPAIVDHAPLKWNRPVSLFESGAILFYLAEKTGMFIPNNLKGRTDVLQWLFWQMSALGPYAGQTLHFLHYADENIPYAKKRYMDETSRLFKVLDNQLNDHEYIAGKYSIADMACYPWITVYDRLNQRLEDFPNLYQWHERIKSRPAVSTAYKTGRSINTLPTITEESKKILLGQNASNLAVNQ